MVKDTPIGIIGSLTRQEIVAKEERQEYEVINDSFNNGINSCKVSILKMQVLSQERDVDEVKLAPWIGTHHSL